MEEPPLSEDALKSKKSELRLYCDLLMQQVHNVKTVANSPDGVNGEVRDRNALFNCYRCFFLLCSEDVFDHCSVLKKLYVYGICANILNWFKSYLSNREQFASINNTYSDKNIFPVGFRKALY